MFTIEHGFDATTVTLIDDDATSPLREDVVTHSFEDCVTVEQWNPSENRIHKITLSLGQLRDLSAALDLPEGVYQLVAK